MDCHGHRQIRLPEIIRKNSGQELWHTSFQLYISPQDTTENDITAILELCGTTGEPMPVDTENNSFVAMRKELNHLPIIPSLRKTNNYISQMYVNAKSMLDVKILKFLDSIAKKKKKRIGCHKISNKKIKKM